MPFKFQPSWDLAESECVLRFVGSSSQPRQSRLVAVAHFKPQHNRNTLHTVYVRLVAVLLREREEREREPLSDYCPKTVRKLRTKPVNAEQNAEASLQWFHAVR